MKREFEKFYFQGVIQDLSKLIDDNDDACEFYQKCIDYFEGVIASVSDWGSDELLSDLHQLKEYYQKRLVLRKFNKILK